jgi:hypothetical protein
MTNVIKSNEEISGSSFCWPLQSGYRYRVTIEVEPRVNRMPSHLALPQSAGRSVTISCEQRPDGQWQSRVEVVREETTWGI